MFHQKLPSLLKTKLIILTTYREHIHKKKYTYYKMNTLCLEYNGYNKIIISINIKYNKYNTEL